MSNEGAKLGNKLTGQKVGTNKNVKYGNITEDTWKQKERKDFVVVRNREKSMSMEHI